jgi:hypothetical protein
MDITQAYTRFKDLIKISLWKCGLIWIITDFHSEVLSQFYLILPIGVAAYKDEECN